MQEKLPLAQKEELWRWAVHTARRESSIPGVNVAMEIELEDKFENVTAVVEAADKAGLAKIVACLEPKICVKG